MPANTEEERERMAQKVHENLLVLGFVDYEISDVFDDLKNESHWDADKTLERAVTGLFKPWKTVSKPKGGGGDKRGNRDSRRRGGRDGGDENGGDHRRPGQGDGPRQVSEYGRGRGRGRGRADRGRGRVGDANGGSANGRRDGGGRGRGRGDFPEGGRGRGRGDGRFGGRDGRGRGRGDGRGRGRGNASGGAPPQPHQPKSAAPAAETVQPVAVTRPPAQRAPVTKASYSSTVGNGTTFAEKVKALQKAEEEKKAALAKAKAKAAAAAAAPPPQPKPGRVPVQVADPPAAQQVVMPPLATDPPKTEASAAAVAPAVADGTASADAEKDEGVDDGDAAVSTSEPTPPAAVQPIAQPVQPAAPSVESQPVQQLPPARTRFDQPQERTVVMPNSPPKNLQGLDVEFGADMTSGPSGFTFGVGMGNGSIGAVSVAPAATTISATESSKAADVTTLLAPSATPADLPAAVQVSAAASIPVTSAGAPPTAAPPQAGVPQLSQQPGIMGVGGQSVGQPMGQGVSVGQSIGQSVGSQPPVSQSHSELSTSAPNGSLPTTMSGGGIGLSTGSAGASGQQMPFDSSWGSTSGIPGAAMGMPGSYPIAAMPMGFPIPPMGYQQPFDDTHFRAMSAFPQDAPSGYGGHAGGGGRGDVFSGRDGSGQQQPGGSQHSSSGRSQDGKFGGGSSSRGGASRSQQPQSDSSTLPQSLGSGPSGAQMYPPGIMMGVPGGMPPQMMPYQHYYNTGMPYGHAQMPTQGFQGGGGKFSGMQNYFPSFPQQPVFPSGGGSGSGTSASQADASQGYDSRSGGGHSHGSKQAPESSMSSYGASYGMGFGEGPMGGYLQTGSGGPHSQSHSGHSQSSGGSKSSQSQPGGYGGVPQDAPGQKGKDSSRGSGRGGFGGPQMRQMQGQYMMGPPFMGGYNS
mmetsp:Transcript_16979/g.44223  ORF Transcript_16979/g.44223 Transcript_16979/m.44223 type:complete len:913 (-) Transcript_16979:38-2776(-)